MEVLNEQEEWTAPEQATQIEEQYPGEEEMIASLRRRKIRPELVMACKEHLLRKAERTGYDGIQRTRVRMELNALIRELQD